MSSRARWVILTFGLIGLAFAGESTYVHYRLLTDPTYVSPCNIGHTFNCSAAYLSRFGSVAGVPVAVGGMVWFALVALIAGLSLRPSRDAEAGTAAGAYLFVLSVIGLAAILYLGWASFVELRTVCLLCMGTYVCVLAIFITTGLTATGGLSNLPARFVRDLRRLLTTPALLVLTILYVGGFGAVVALFPKEARTVTLAAAPAQSVEDRFAQAWAQQPRVDLGVPADGAKVVIVKFNDWMCPSCKGYHLAYQPVLDKYAKSNPGAVKYVTKDWPWNSSCNFRVPQTFVGHESSCEAAVAVRIARDAGKGDEMVNWIFANQERLDELGQHGPEAVNEIRAEATKLSGVTDYDREFARKIDDVKRDVADGAALNIQATPTYFVNGVRTTDPAGQNLPPQFLDLAIKLELNKDVHK